MITVLKQRKWPPGEWRTQMTSVNIAHTEDLGRLGRLASAVSRAVTHIKQRRELMGLLDMPDYLLKDIGLQRHEITREGLKRFWE
jgi:uncharacterized protein YjiS (DUF1127 family)